MKAGTKQMMVTHAKAFPGSDHKSHETHETITPNTIYMSVPEARQATTKKPKRKRFSKNSCAKSQGS